MNHHYSLVLCQHSISKIFSFNCDDLSPLLNQSIILGMIVCEATVASVDVPVISDMLDYASFSSISWSSAFTHLYAILLSLLYPTDRTISSYPFGRSDEKGGYG